MKIIKIIIVLSLTILSFANADSLKRRIDINNNVLLECAIVTMLHAYANGDYAEIAKNPNHAKNFENARLGVAELHFLIYLEWKYSNTVHNDSKVARSYHMMMKQLFQKVKWREFAEYMKIAGKNNIKEYFSNYNEKNYDADLESFKLFIDKLID